MARCFAPEGPATQILGMPSWLATYLLANEDTGMSTGTGTGTGVCMARQSGFWIEMGPLQPPPLCAAGPYLQGLVLDLIRGFTKSAFGFTKKIAPVLRSAF